MILIGLSIKGPVAIENILMPPRLIKIARRGPYNQLIIANWILKKLIKFNCLKSPPLDVIVNRESSMGECMPIEWKSPLLDFSKASHLMFFNDIHAIKMLTHSRYMILFP